MFNDKAIQNLFWIAFLYVKHLTANCETLYIIFPKKVM
jgi:hypothetical protein